MYIMFIAGLNNKYCVWDIVCLVQIQAGDSRWYCSEDI